MNAMKMYIIAVAYRALDKAVVLLEEAGYVVVKTENGWYDNNRYLVPMLTVKGFEPPTMFFDDMDIQYDKNIKNFYVW